VTRILHVAQPVDGGVGRYVADLACAQAAAGVDIVVASPPGPLADDLARAGVRWTRWDAARAPGPSALGETRRLGLIVRELRPDVVHLHSSKAGLDGRLLLRGRVPTVFQPHGWSWQAGGGAVGAASIGWERFAARWTDLLVCVSADERRAGEARRVVSAGRRAEVVPNGVDLARFRPVDATARTQLRRAAALDPAAPVAVCVGRLDRQKGQDVLVQAWAQVRQACPEAVLLLVGDGPAREAIAAQVSSLSLESGVQILGEQPDAPRFYAMADVVAFASQWGEAMALTPLEGMACGRPVVATDVAGVRESVGAGCGAIVPAGDAGALASALADRLRAPDLAASEGRTARAYAEAHHDIRATHARLTELTVGLAAAAGGLRRR
jgi:glycosyltransferase involved in cell wall biosynthesis